MVVIGVLFILLIFEVKSFNTNKFTSEVNNTIFESVPLNVEYELYDVNK